MPYGFENCESKSSYLPGQDQYFCLSYRGPKLTLIFLALVQV